MLRPAIVALLSFIFLFGRAAVVLAVEAARPWLGVAIDQAKNGVLVKEAIEGTPAAAAGLRKGDIITAVDSVPVTSPETLIRLIQSKGVGNEVTVQFSRDTKSEARKIKLQAKPDELELLRQKFVGKPAPAFDLPQIGQKSRIRLADLRDKVVIIEFWTTWCPACLSTHPRLTEWLKAKPDVTVLAVSNEEKGVLEDFVKKSKPSFPIVHDDQGQVHGQWLVKAIPQIVVIDKKGIVQHATIGAGSYLEEALKVAEQLRP